MIMEIWQVFTEPQNLFFSVCLTVCVFIVALELIGMIVGASSDWADNFIPDALKIDIDGVQAADGLFVTLSSWIYLGRMPFLIWLIVFFGGWGVTGTVLQLTMEDIFGNPLIALIAVPIAFFINLFVVRYFCMAMKPILPKDESFAVQTSDFIGIEAEIVVGVAKLNSPAQAKLTDRYGTTHYIMVVPQLDTEFKQGDKVIVAEQNGNIFEAIELGEFKKLTNR